MSTPVSPPPSSKATQTSARKNRLAKALKANIKRRKSAPEASPQRKEPPPGPAGSQA